MKDYIALSDVLKQYYVQPVASLDQPLFTLDAGESTSTSGVVHFDTEDDVTNYHAPSPAAIREEHLDQLVSDIEEILAEGA